MSETFRRHGNCRVCSARVIVEQEIVVTIDILSDPNEPQPIRGKLSDELRKLKRQPIYCNQHVPDDVLIDEHRSGLVVSIGQQSIGDLS